MENKTFIEYRSHAGQSANSKTWGSLSEIPAQRKNFFALYLDQKNGRLFTVKTTRKQEEAK